MCFYLSKIILFFQMKTYVKPKFEKQMKVELLGESVYVCVGVSGVHSLDFISTTLRNLWNSCFRK